MIFCIVTLHLWGILFRKYPDLRGLAYADDGKAVGRLSIALQLLGEGQTLFKEDGNLDFNMGKTKFLAKGPISARHLYERDQHFQMSEDWKNSSARFTRASLVCDK